MRRTERGVAQHRTWVQAPTRSVGAARCVHMLLQARTLYFSAIFLVAKLDLISAIRRRPLHAPTPADFYTIHTAAGLARQLRSGRLPVSLACASVPVFCGERFEEVGEGLLGEEQHLGQLVLLGLRG